MVQEEKNISDIHKRIDDMIEEPKPKSKNTLIIIIGVMAIAIIAVIGLGLKSHSITSTILATSPISTSTHFLGAVGGANTNVQSVANTTLLPFVPILALIIIVWFILKRLNSLVGGLPPPRVTQFDKIIKPSLQKMYDEDMDDDSEE